MLPAVHLVRDAERVSEVDLLAQAVGGRVGLDAVLSDLDRRARRVPAPGTAVDWAVALDLRDTLTLRWWPQGITSSEDRAPGETYGGRHVLVTTSYAKPLGGIHMGSRLTVFDVTDRRRVRYAHVLLVEAVVADDGRVTVRPVRIHAGGIVWHGPYVHVAGTARGLFSFRFDDVVRLPAGTPWTAIGRLDDGRLAGYGHRYALPVRFTYAAVTAEGHERIRYSFLSLDRSGAQHELLAGEYGRRQQTTRLIRYEMEPATGLLSTDPEGASRPLALDLGISRMQGVASVGGRLYVTQSRGRFTRGSLWAGAPGDLVEHERALPPGPEDVCYWPSTQELWTVSEHPLMRLVCALPRARFD